MRRFALVAVLTWVGLIAPSSVQAVIIGLPPDSGGNCFPFGCAIEGALSDRYQQVYDSGEFAGPIDIGTINFFMTATPGGNLNSGTYTLSLSTTAVAVNSLDTTDFDANLGGDNALFTVVVLGGGAAPALLSFSGTPFLYDPTLGNLLLDIQIFDIDHVGPNAFYDARNGTAMGVFSRAHNFGIGFEDYGLVTEFAETDTPIPEPSTLALVGLGLVAVRQRVRRKRQQA